MQNSIQKQFDEVIKYSQNLDYVNTNKLFEQWERAKQGLKSNFFNGELTYTYPEKVQFTLDEDAQLERYQSFIEYVNNLTSRDGKDDFIDYLFQIGYKNFYNNTLDRDYIVFSGKKIQKGTKVVKSFKYFIIDQILLKDIQSKASEIIQENKVEGYLTFSIHPLDYLSISETTYNWRSCHSLDGEYRGGNLSYMTDTSTVICYLSNGDNNTKLPRFPKSVPWNSKKWRCLLFFDQKHMVAFAGRQYPFFSPGALEKVREAFIEGMVPEETSWWCSGKQKWSHWHDDYFTSHQYKEYPEDSNCDLDDGKYFPLNEKILDLYEIVQDKPHSLQFNDLLRSCCYEYPYYMFQLRPDSSHNVKFYIGGAVACLRCGKNVICDTDKMICPDCACDIYDENIDDEKYPICDCCGNRHYIEDSNWVGDEQICDNCFHSECFRCESCGINYFNTQKHWVEEEQLFLCDYCFERYNKRKQITRENSTASLNLDLSPCVAQATETTISREEFIEAFNMVNELFDVNTITNDIPVVEEEN